MISSPWAGGSQQPQGGLPLPPRHPHFFPALSALGVLWPLLGNARPWDRAKGRKWEEGALICPHSKEQEH